MPMNQDNTLSKESLRSESSTFLICLLTISYPGLSEPIRLSNDMTELYEYHEESGEPIYCTKSQGQTYIATQFSFIAPSVSDGNTIPRAKLIVSNVDRRMTQAIRGIHQAATLKAVFVNSHDTNLVEYEVPTLTLDNIEYDAAQISGELVFAHFLENQCPSLTFGPNLFPGLFK